MAKLDSLTSKFLSEKESWEKNMASVEESWRCKISMIYLESPPSLSLSQKGVVSDGKICQSDDAVKCESVKAESNGHAGDELKKNLVELTIKHEKLKVPL